MLGGLIAPRFLFVLPVYGFLAACTPFIPVKDDFGSSAAVPAGNIPPEFAEFNAYDPAINPLLANQLCATPYEPIEDKIIAAEPGRIVAERGRCQTHIPFWDNGR